MTALGDLFPFRRASVWGGYRSNAIVPIRWGEQIGECVPYETSNRDDTPRTRFVWSDGVCAGIDRVWVNGQQAAEWRAETVTDTVGKPVMMIRFGRPVPIDSVVTAKGRGRISGGAMIVNPALVLADLLQIAGIAAPSLGLFQVETERAGLRLAGQVPPTDGLKIDEAVTSICRSIGARYSPRMRSWAMLYPGGIPQLVNSEPYIAARLDATHLGTARAQLSDAVNSLSIEFDMRDGQPAQVMELEAADSVAALGRRPETLRADWIGSPGQAADLAGRILPYLARPAYAVEFSGVRADLRPGDWVRVDASDSHIPFATGVHRVIAADYDVMRETSAGSFELWADPAPAVTIVRQASLIETEALPEAQQRIVGSTRQITLGSQGSPLSNRHVVLDGHLTRYSDGAGVVTFPLADTPAGWHDLEISIASVSAGTAGTGPDFGENGGDLNLGSTAGTPGSITSGSITIRILFT